PRRRPRGGARPLPEGDGAPARERGGLVPARRLRPPLPQLPAGGAPGARPLHAAQPAGSGQQGIRRRAEARELGDADLLSGGAGATVRDESSLTGGALVTDLLQTGGGLVTDLLQSCHGVLRFVR